MTLATLPIAREAIQNEALGLQKLAAYLDHTLEQVVHLILGCQGRLIVSGMGKSGHIARKIAATFASTGTLAFFVHPAEAQHGDLGMIDRKDVVLAISKSGEAPELAGIVQYCRRFSIALVAITSRAESTLAHAANHVLLLPDIEETCPLGLAPTTSTTMTLALGDALAIACMQARDFRPAQFKVYHPGGSLGQKLTRVRDIMHAQDLLPLIHRNGLLSEAVLQMSKGRFGCVGVLDDEGHLIGIFTDGDLRRHFTPHNLERPIHMIMSTNPYQIAPQAMIADVLALFTEKKIPSVFVCEANKPVGLIHVHDLFQRGLL